jgi:hypothetical protein
MREKIKKYKLLQLLLVAIIFYIIWIVLKGQLASHFEKPISPK